MLIFKQIIDYFLIFKKYIGQRLYIVFILTAAAALTEGFGIAMLLPLIDATGVSMGEGIEQSVVKTILKSILDFIGIGSSLIGILLFIAAVFMVKGGIIFLANAYQIHLKAELMLEMKSLMFDKYSTMTYGYYIQKNTGHFVNMINGQVNGLVGSFGNYKNFLATLITALTYLATAFLLAWNFALMAIVSGVLILLLFRRLNVYVHSLSRLSAEEQGIVNKFMVQTMQSFKYLCSTAQIEFLRTEVMDSIGRLTKYTRRQGIAQSLTVALGEPVAIIFVLLVIIIQVEFLKAPLAPIFVALLLFNRAMVSILGIQRAWQSTLNKVGSLELVEREFEILEKCQEQSGRVKIPPFSGNIELRNISFAYDKGTDVIKDFSLTIPANSTVAFVGESGAGKSTLVDILTLLLRPGKGEIFIDGIPSTEIQVGSWRRQIGYVSQETVVFDDTIANNISLWKEDYRENEAAREKIEAAAQQAYATGFISDLPKQFDTMVGDRGVRLSGGQQQRLFLARELYKNPRLLILDEATSALDSQSERFIQESIDRLKGDLTVVIIAHRLSTIKNADCIYVVEKGKIIEQGPYDKLVSLGGRFNKMVGVQSL